MPRQGAVPLPARPTVEVDLSLEGEVQGRRPADARRSAGWPRRL